MSGLPEIAAGTGGSASCSPTTASTAPSPGGATEARRERTHSATCGPARFRPPPASSPAVDGRAFFAADDGVHGRELWTSDGTEAGTHLVTDLVPGAGSSLPQWLTPVDGVLYFSAFRPDVGVELWRTDGTEAGTELVADVYPGAEPSTPEFLTVAGRRLFFTANDGEHGFEPWALLLPGRLPKMSLSWSGTPLPGYDPRLRPRPHQPAAAAAAGRRWRRDRPAAAGRARAASTTGTRRAARPTSASSGRGGGAASAAAHGLLPGRRHVPWNGELPPGGTVTITFPVRIRPEVALGTSFLLVADGLLDSDEDGVSDLAFVSDDPGQPGDEDPTRLIVAPLGLDVPALGSAALAALIVLLAGAALRRLAQ